MQEESKQKFLQDFNKAIKRVNKEIEKDQYMKNPEFYNLIKNAMHMICERVSYEPEIEREQIRVIKEGAMFGVILEFFKSINEELYIKAKQILNREYPNTTVYLYDFHKSETDHNSWYHINYANGRATVYLPLRHKITKQESEEIDLEYGEDYATLDDLYAIVHEISHLFDLDIQNITNFPSSTRDVLLEITPTIFEHLLSQYLLENKLVDEGTIIKKQNNQTNNLIHHANVARVKLVFGEIFKRKGIITEEDIIEVMKKDSLNPKEFRCVLDLITYYNFSIIENKRYAFAAMYAQIISQMCREDANVLKEYLRMNMENEPYSEILKSLGIDIHRDVNEFVNKQTVDREEVER